MGTASEGGQGVDLETEGGGDDRWSKMARRGEGMI